MILNARAGCPSVPKDEPVGKTGQAEQRALAGNQEKKSL